VTLTQGTSTPITILPGEKPVAVTDAGNSPAGLLLLNRGDNGGTIMVQPGPTGGSSAIALGPSGSLQWTDTTAYPYAYVAAGGTVETLLITSQATAYSNPEAVAIATAAQLAIQGVPTLYRNKVIADLTVPATLIGAPDLDVSAYASLLVGIKWGANPAGPGAVALVPYDPQGVGGINLATTQTIVGMDSSAGSEWCWWQLPVVSERFQINPVVTAGRQQSTDVIVIGSTRPVAGFRQLGDRGAGARMLHAASPTASTTYNLVPYNNQFEQVNTGQSVLTRMNGKVTVSIQASGPGTLTMFYVDYTGSFCYLPFTVPSGRSLLSTAHPSLPVQWKWVPDTSVVNGFAYVTVIAETTP
jgi:hypothetical protein